MRNRKLRAVLVPAAMLALGLSAAACGSQGGNTGSGSGTPAASATSGGSQGTTLKTETTGLGTVLANAQGRTLYWFAIDTPSASKCTAGCLSIWPVVKGAPHAAAGASISGSLSDFTRSDGIVQATWNGHPLYTYSGDTAAGQTAGNGINSFGGVWHAAVISSSGSSPSPSPSSGGGGYGGGY